MAKDKNTRPLTVSQIINYITRNQIRIPEYQREKVWGAYQKKLLIDSILRGIDIPKLYFSKKINSTGRLDYYDVVDGQQRLGTIKEFVDDKFSLDNDAAPIDGIEIKGLKYSELDEELDLDFQNTSLDVVILTEWTRDDEKEMFSRLQEGSPLNAAEKRRSYRGEIPKKIEELRAHRLFNHESIFGFKDKRFAYEDGCSKIFHQFIKGEITSIRPDEIRKTYKEYQDGGTKVDQAIRDINRCFDLTFEAINERAIKLKKYSLIRLPWLMDHIRKVFSINDDLVKSIGLAYEKFDYEIAQDKEKPEEERDPIFVNFRNAARSDSPGNQALIHETLLRFILNEIPNMVRKDNQRNFSPNQRYIIFKNSNSKCQADTKAIWYDHSKCSIDIDLDDFHADHIKAHTNGGKTSIENGQALCAHCNLSKSSS